MHYLPQLKREPLAPPSYARGASRTPLGDIEIDKDLAAETMRLNSDLLDLPPAHANEHSLEVQLPLDGSLNCIVHRGGKPFQLRGDI